MPHWLIESWRSMQWWLRLEIRKGHSFITTLLFSTLILLVVGLFSRRMELSDGSLRLLFWLSFAFALFQTIPRPILDRRPEEWRWLHQFFSREGNVGGLWMYALLLSLLVGLYLGGGAYFLWGYKPSFGAIVLGGPTLSLPLTLAAYLTARAEASYAVTGVLGFPLLIFPLLWVCIRSQPALFPLGALLGVESLLFFFLLPSVWSD
ncbi:MAG: hypothetical protein N3E49_03355 [Bacteroidia bacterium]|nr:hypothetical protein [Bacteroidia bacterium]